MPIGIDQTTGNIILIDNKDLELDFEKSLGNPSVDGYVLSSTIAGVRSWVANGSGSGATTALDNLASVAINASLISDTNNTYDLGSSAIQWRDLYLAGNLSDGTNNIPISSIMLNTGDTASGDYNFSSDTLFVDSANSRVGIGTASPGAPFEVDGGTDSLIAQFKSSVPSARAQFAVYNSAPTNTSNKATFYLRALTTTATRTMFQFDSKFSDNTDATRTSYTQLLSADNGSFVTAISILGSKIGMGVGTPSERLDISGNLKLSGNLTDGTNSLTVANAKTAYDHTSLTNNPHTVTKAQVGLGSVEDTALSTWAGTVNITTLGTIANGTWNGTTIAVANGGTGATTASGARTNLNVDIAGTDNSTNVSLLGTPNYLTISGQAITLNKLDITDDTNLTAGTGLTLSTNTLSVDTSQTQITAVGTLVTGNATAIVDASSLTVAGKVELGTVTETNTGTDATRATTPDGIAGSYAGTKTIGFIVVEATTDVATGTGKAHAHIPANLNGMNLVSVHAEVVTAGTTGVSTFDVNKNGTTMLSTKITIDSAETGSDTAATAPVIDGTNDDVATNDVISVDIDGISTTAPKGLIITLEFRLP